MLQDTKIAIERNAQYSPDNRYSSSPVVAPCPQSPIEEVVQRLEKDMEELAALGSRVKALRNRLIDPMPEEGNIKEGSATLCSSIVSRLYQMHDRMQNIIHQAHINIDAI